MQHQSNSLIISLHGNTREVKKPAMNAGFFIGWIGLKKSSFVAGGLEKTMMLGLCDALKHIGFQVVLAPDFHVRSCLHILCGINHGAVIPAQ